MFRDPIPTAQPDRLRDEAISSVTRNVRGHLNAGRFDEASRVLADALERYPGDLILEGVGAAITAAQRRQAGQIASVSRPVPLQGMAARRTIPIVSAAGFAILALIVAAGAWEFSRPGRSLPDTRDTTGTPVKSPAPETPEISRLRNALTSAIQARSWDEAQLWGNRLAELNPGDPGLRDWLEEVDRGKAADRKLADLRMQIQSAIRAKNWSEADAKSALLLAQVPADPDALQWQQAISEGRKQDRLTSDNAVHSKQAGALRAEIPLFIQAKRWDEAQKRITDLQIAVPNDTEADAWQKALTILRISELKQQMLADSPAASAQTPPPAPGNPPGGANGAAAATESGRGPVSETLVAGLRQPAAVPAPVATPLPASLPAPVPASPSPSPAVAPAPRVPIVIPPVAESPLISRIKPIAGHWTFSNPKAPKPRITNGFQFSAETVVLDLYPDGGGVLEYQAKPGIWHVAETTVKFRFRLGSWDGQKLVGKSEDGEKVYSLSLEPSQNRLNLAWRAVKNGGKMSEGVAPLTRSAVISAK